MTTSGFCWLSMMLDHFKVAWVSDQWWRPQGSKTYGFWAWTINLNWSKVVRIIWVQGVIKMFLLSLLLEYDPTVCLPEKSNVTRGLVRGWPSFSLGDKPSGHIPTMVIIDIFIEYFCIRHQVIEYLWLCDRRQVIEYM